MKRPSIQIWISVAFYLPLHLFAYFWLLCLQKPSWISQLQHIVKALQRETRRAIDATDMLQLPFIGWREAAEIRDYTKRVHKRRSLDKQSDKLLYSWWKRDQNIGFPWSDWHSSQCDAKKKSWQGQWQISTCSLQISRHNEWNRYSSSEAWILLAF